MRIRSGDRLIEKWGNKRTFIVEQAGRFGDSRMAGVWVKEEAVGVVSLWFSTGEINRYFHHEPVED